MFGRKPTRLWAKGVSLFTGAEKQHANRDVEPNVLCVLSPMPMQEAHLHSYVLCWLGRPRFLRIVALWGFPLPGLVQATRVLRTASIFISLADMVLETCNAAYAYAFLANYQK